MRADEIRRRYLEFFEKKGHRVVPSSSLVPENDPTTLFTGSGMQPMLPYFLGTPHPLGTRIADSQKCFRSQDIEEVGDNRHTTFFEMLGNWSFGDYFKEEQITWMWDFLIDEMKLDPKRLYFTCFRGNEALGVQRDDESAELWQKLYEKIGIDAKIVNFPERDGMQEGRIFYYDEKKNWWSRSGVPENMPIGEPGGPDTEMFWDFGVGLGLHEKSPWKNGSCHVNCDCGRFLEIGNNVFMQYKKTAQGFEELTQKNVDFGGGLERLMAASQDEPDIFRGDIFKPLREGFEAISGRKYGFQENETYAFRVLLDHLRSSVFLIADGVIPSNAQQGYVLRRLLRRAIRYADILNIPVGSLSSSVSALAFTYEESYPVIREKESLIKTTIEKEEDKFRKTLEKGLAKLQELVRRKENETPIARRDDGQDKSVNYINAVSGKDAFDLYQNYGFPFELIREELAKHALFPHEKEFREEYDAQLKKHRDLSRTASAGKFKGGLADSSEKTTMLHTSTHLMLAGLRKYLGKDVHQAGSNITEERTRFDFTYPEKVSREILDKVEAYVNEAIAKQAPVVTEVMAKEDAKAAGVEGSFWEKYPDQVTVYMVKAADGTVYSQELCGGPHVKTTTDIKGRFRIVKEEASSAGIRRIKAVLE